MALLIRQHRYSTAHHKISPRKLNMLSRQIAGLPIDEAIVQMQFSEKRASKWIKSTLCLARDHAVDKGLSRDKLIVGEYIRYCACTLAWLSFRVLSAGWPPSLQAGIRSSAGVASCCPRRAV